MPPSPDPPSLGGCEASDGHGACAPTSATCCRQPAAVSRHPSSSLGHPGALCCGSAQGPSCLGSAADFGGAWVGKRGGGCWRMPCDLEGIDAVGSQHLSPALGYPAAPWWDAGEGGGWGFATVGATAGMRVGPSTAPRRLRVPLRMWSESPWERGGRVPATLTLASVSFQGPLPGGPLPAMGSGTPPAPSPHRPPRRPPAPPPTQRTQA